MKKRTRPHWPFLERSFPAGEPPPDPRLDPLTLALLDDYATRGESRGYDPYDANDEARAARAWARTQR